LRVSPHDWCGDAFVNSRRRVNSTVVLQTFFIRCKCVTTLMLTVVCLTWAVVVQTATQPGSQTPPEVSLTYGLVVDNSGSLRSQIDYVLAVGKAIVNNNKRDDTTFLVRFVNSDKIQRVKDFTKDKTSLTKAIDEFAVEGGLSAINDAVYDSAQYLADKSKDTNRHALILITDGYDRNSYFRTDKVISYLKDKNIRLYVIAFTGMVKRDSQESYDRARLYLETLAKESRGRAYFPNNRSELETNTRELIGIMRQP
jgi:VWFA-related protein